MKIIVFLAVALLPGAWLIWVVISIRKRLRPVSGDLATCLTVVSIRYLRKKMGRIAKSEDAQIERKIL